MAKQKKKTVKMQGNTTMGLYGLDAIIMVKNRMVLWITTLRDLCISARIAHFGVIASCMLVVSIAVALFSAHEATGSGRVETIPNLVTITQTVNELQVAIPQREQSLIELRASLIERNERLTSMPAIWPANGQVTSRFGPRSRDFHPGIDIANDYGTPIVTAASGRVSFSGWNDGGYGQMVKIDHGNGFETVYAHNSRNAVRVGDKVQKGAVIAYMGSTGMSTGSHVHYEVRINGTAVDPAKYL